MTTEEIDLLPEYIDWKDKGCDLCPTCLDCALPRCVEEEPRGKQRLRMKTRSQQIAAMKQAGKSIDEIAKAFGISTRTVHRALVAARNGKGRAS
jgi:hypothetical protein